MKVVVLTKSLIYYNLSNLCDIQTEIYFNNKSHESVFLNYEEEYMNAFSKQTTSVLTLTETTCKMIQIMIFITRYPCKHAKPFKFYTSQVTADSFLLFYGHYMT